jgi:D-inositol-3-phosphate glycosyltransferase
MRRLAVLSLHTSPLAQPGTGDGGGMNVYVRELSAALARAGVTCDVFTRAWSERLPEVVDIEPGFRLHHVAAGPPAVLAKEDLPAVIDEFADGVLARMREIEDGDGVVGPFEAVHANYWLSGVAGHTIKHELDLPLVCTFHTLDRVKAESTPEEVHADAAHRRAEAEAEVIRCSDTVLASCTVEASQIRELYHADPRRIRIVAPGVDHAFFGPGDRAQARRALDLPPKGPLLLFVGRIQPLKALPTAVRVLDEVRRGYPDAHLVVVGGPSGPHGAEEVERTHTLVRDLGLDEQVVFVPPRPHELLSTFYRAADVCVVPSRSESFGLVALEAAACGVPVVASDVGGLRSLVDDGTTGFLIDDTTPGAFARRVTEVLDDPIAAERMGTEAVLRARGYTWAGAARSLREVYAELTESQLVECS